MFDIITFGSASRDIFLESKKIKAEEKKTFFSNEGIYLSLGSKIDVENIYYFSGGGGTNSAALFSKMGLKTGYCGSIGDDEAGRDVIEEIKNIGVDVSLVFKIKNKKTNQSVIFNIKDKDRTILVYRGASEYLNNNLFPLPKTKWFYIAPLSGRASYLFSKIVSYGKKNDIKIAVNLGSSQILMKGIKKMIEKVDILILNQEESSMLSKISMEKEKEILKAIRSFYKGILVVTKGPLGSMVLNKDNLYKAGIINTKITDRTGAGDAFGSGFVSKYILSNNIEKSIQFATNNSASVIASWGAKTGLLKKGTKLKEVKVKKEKF